MWRQNHRDMVDRLQDLTVDPEHAGDYRIFLNWIDNPDFRVSLRDAELSPEWLALNRESVRNEQQLVRRSQPPNDHDHLFPRRSDKDRGTGTRHNVALKLSSGAACGRNDQPATDAAGARRVHRLRRPQLSSEALCDPNTGRWLLRVDKRHVTRYR